MGPPGDRGALPHRPRAGDQRGVRRVRRRQRLREPAVVERRGLELAAGGGRNAPRLLETRVSRPVAGEDLRPLGAASGRSAGDPRQLVRGRGVLPLGRAASGDRDRVGDGRSRGPRRRHGRGSRQARLPLGRSAARTYPRQPRLGRRRPVARGRACGGRQPRRLPADDRQRLGSGRPTSSTPTPDSSGTPTRNTRSPGSATARCCAAAAGPPAPTSSATPGATSSRRTGGTCWRASAPARGTSRRSEGHFGKQENRNRQNRAGDPCRTHPAHGQPHLGQPVGANPARPRDTGSPPWTATSASAATC